MRRLALFLGLGLLLAGCGGGGSPDYTVQKTERCLTKQGLKISHTVDFVASTATGGSFKTFLPSNDVTVVFGLTSADAGNIDQAYRRFHAENVGIDDVLFEDRNAVMLWHFHPSDADKATIGDCLTS